ncbi:MAG: dephospho-CoA kinase [Bacteroidota bacterium]
MKSIGITGGIGSGKSFVCSLFEKLGYAIYSADARARILMTEDAVLVAGVKDLFGEQAYLPDGSLNRALIGGIVFHDADKLAQLNALVHPATGRDYLAWHEKVAQSDYDKAFALKEAAILFESGAYKTSNGVISVYAPKQLRLERVMARDKVKKEAVEARMRKQWPEIEKQRRADFLFINDGLHHLLPQVKAAIQFFSN